MANYLKQVNQGGMDKCDGYTGGHRRFESGDEMTMKIVIEERRWLISAGGGRNSHGRKIINTRPREDSTSDVDL